MYNKNILLLIAGIVGTIYVLSMSQHILNVFMLPHIIIITIAVLINWVAFWLNDPWGSLTSGALYTVSSFFWLINIYRILLPMILCYLAFGFIMNQRRCSRY